MDRSDLEPAPASSHPKVELTGGEKRRTGEGDDDLDASADVDPKRVKMRDLVSVFRSECESARAKETPDQFGLAVSEPSHRPQLLLKRCSSVPKDPTLADSTLDNAADSAQILLDLSTGAMSTRAHDTSNLASSSSMKLDRTEEPKTRSSPALDLDLNVADASDMMEDYNPFHPYKKPGQVKPVDASECGSTTGPPEDNNNTSGSLRVWREMKQNGFLSSSHGGIPLPKKRGRPAKKRKEGGELKAGTEKEQLQQQGCGRFARVAAPSGLLSGLNPGIINHVRNSKQVLSIIKAMVSSENLDSKGVAAIGNTARGSETMFGGGSGSRMVEKGISPDGCLSSSFTSDHEGDALSLKLGSQGTSDNGSGTSSDGISMRQEKMASLSLKGAHVASQWLQLLYQDLKGRLAALRRSKKRVRNVIQIELPRLLSEENMSGKENGLFHERCSDAGTVADKHFVRWKAIFCQMERSLSEEGKHLEIWMEQVKEMQLHCYRGLSCINAKDLPSNGSPNAFRSRRSAEALEREAAIKASAASIYSTCNFAMSAENVRCC